LINHKASRLLSLGVLWRASEKARSFGSHQVKNFNLHNLIVQAASLHGENITALHHSRCSARLNTLAASPVFGIYMNDLPSVTRKCHLESYVDDSKVLMSFYVRDIDAAKSNLEEDLQRVAKWCSVNQLLINPDKTKFLLIGTRQMIQRLPQDIELSFLYRQTDQACNKWKGLGCHS
jgi:hypothetical protein